MAGYSLFVALHVSAGVLALALFWINALMRKGGAMHRLVGRAYLVAMTAIGLTGIPLVAQRVIDGHPVTASFLAYLIVLTSTAAWLLWRAPRDRQAPQRYAGPVFRSLAMLNLLAGAAVLVIGLRVGAPLLIGFSAVGLFTGQDMLRRRARIAQVPMWWRKEHYTAVLAAGIATHIAFLAIGLPRLLPGVSGTALHYLAWFGPLVVALVAKLWLDRRHRGSIATRPAAAAATAPIR